MTVMGLFTATMAGMPMRRTRVESGDYPRMGGVGLEVACPGGAGAPVLVARAA